jgi:hypothetical protein
MKLRSKATIAQGMSQEMSQLRAALAQRPEKIPDYLTNAMASGLATAENWKRKNSAERLERMKAMLKLSDEQIRAIGSVMTNYIDRQSKMVMDLIAGKMSGAQLQEERAKGSSEDAEIRALLTREQLADSRNMTGPRNSSPLRLWPLRMRGRSSNSSSFQMSNTGNCGRSSFN